jgi:serine/threonine-protein kinase
VGPYELLERLGSGSSAQVWLARREGIERRFAVKILPANLDAESQARLDREARVASRLEHPGLVRVIDVGRFERRSYLVMEHVPGPTLQEWLEGRGPVPWREAVGLVSDLAAALQVAHQAGVFHRDLKPANVILDQRDGRPRVTDFGLAHDAQSDLGLTSAGEVLGTPYYMAPEQVRGAGVDASCDVYALGVILYEMLAGQRPYESSSVPELYGLIQEANPVPLRELQPDLPDALCEVCQRAFDSDRERRPPDAGGLLAELQSVAAGAEPAALEVHAPEAASRAPLVVAAVLAGLVLTGFLGWSVSWAAAARRAATELQVAGGEVDGLQEQLERDRAASLQRDAKLEAWAEEVAALGREAERLETEEAALLSELRVEARRGVQPLGTLGAAIDRTVEALREAGQGAGLAANLLRNRGRYVEAAELARDAWERGDRDLELLVVEFRAWQAAGQPDRSMPPLRTLLQQAPQGSPHHVFGQALSGGLGDREASIRRLIESAEAGPGAPSYLWILAGHMLRSSSAHARGGAKRDHLQRLLEVANRAVEAEPCCPDSRELRAAALVGLRQAGAAQEGDVERVLVDCRVAREIKPSELECWLLAGQILTLAGRPVQAELELAEAAQRARAASDRPRAALVGARAGVWLANAYLVQGDEEGAERAVRQALGGGPGVAQAALELGGFLERASSDLRARLLAMVDPELRPRLEGRGRPH